MSQTIDRTSECLHNEQTRRQFLRRMVAMAGAFVALCTVREAGADDWMSLYGYLTSPPAVGRNEDGRLEVFVRGGDYALYHKWQTSPNGPWSDWNRLGGIVTSNIAVSNNLDGRLEVFLRGTDNSLFHRWQTSPNGDWSGWNSLGGYVTSDPTVARNWDGRMEVFVRNTDNGVSHRWQVAPNSDWSGWENFTDTRGLVAGNIAAIAHNAGGGLNLFWRGPDNRLRWKRQTQADGAWQSTRSLGGPIIASEPAVGEYDGEHVDPRLVVFVRGSDNAIWYRVQAYPNSTTWNPWVSMGGSYTGNVAVGTNWDGRLEIFVRGTDNVPHRNYQVEPNGSWSGWRSLGGYLTSDPAVGTEADRLLVVFGRGGDGALWHRWQATPGGDF